MVVIGVYNNFIIIYGWCKSVESFWRDFFVIFLWCGVDFGEIVVWCWYYNFFVKVWIWMFKRIDLVVDRFLYVII